MDERGAPPFAAANHLGIRKKTDFSGEGTRTLDTADMSRMLYHLSYAAVVFFRRDYSGASFLCQSRILT